MNIKEFIKWLDQFPDDTEVEVAVQRKASEWQAYGEVMFEEEVKDYHEFYHQEGKLPKLYLGRSD